MRARLSRLLKGEQFCFICLPGMADKIGRVVDLAGGEVVQREERQYGVVISVKKR